MPLTPDRRPGGLDEEEILLEDRVSDGDPVAAGAIRYVNGAFRLRDALGTYDPRTGETLNVGADTDFLLENEPPEPTNTYTATRTSGVVTLEEWRRGDTTLIKDIQYTRTGGIITQEVRRVFALDGTTVLGQLTIVYTRTGGIVTSATRTRV